MATAMAELAERAATMWVVLGPDGRVLIAFSGELAEEAAREWETDGFRVRAVED